MSDNCESSDGHSIALPNPTSNSATNISTLIPSTIELKVNIGAITQIANPISTTILNSASQAIINSGTYNERCLHPCKEHMYRDMREEPLRIEFRPLKYSGRSRAAKFINEKFSEILVDGSPNHHLMICKCNRLMARNQQFENNTKRHLRSRVILKAAERLKMKAQSKTELMNPIRKF